MTEKKPNATVTCSHCGTEIWFVKEPNLPNGFSLVCSKCVRRKIYRLEDVHIPREVRDQSHWLPLKATVAVGPSAEPVPVKAQRYRAHGFF